MRFARVDLRSTLEDVGRVVLGVEKLMLCMHICICGCYGVQWVAACCRLPGAMFMLLKVSFDNCSLSLALSVSKFARRCEKRIEKIRMRCRIKLTIDAFVVVSKS
jgi:hypothetical protein